ncbi:MAG: serine protein kinase PrkA [Myxococcota bacterium]
MGEVKDELHHIGEKVRERFEAQKRVLSFQEYLAEFLDHPWRHSRDAARYLRDCFDHFGSYDLERPWGSERRWRLFDLPFERAAEEALGDGRRRSDHLVGHEGVQNAVYRILSNFSREGRANRLILLHGPNGSAKSTFTDCLMRGLEHYSGTPEGALYRFAWIFPRGRDGQAIGFGSGDSGPRAGETYAHLPDDRVEVKLSSELREHPLLLLPTEERRRLVLRAYGEHAVGETPPDWMWNGQLGHKNRLIFEALLTAYRGDLERVLAHVQVERYYVSRRYRVAAVVIGPQMAVDAHERQITADRSLAALPASLSALTLFEPYGELVDASGGVVEYSDLLKRPLDAWKYLLLAIETGEVSLNLTNLPINAVLVATSNELHLNAFKEHPEYNSFRGRIQPVRVPYLLDYVQEQGIYDAQIVPQVRRHVAPHATFVAALWTVLTRLRRSQPDRFTDTALGKLAADLSPMEKAELYAHGTIPDRLDSEDAKLLRSGVRTIHEETEATADYEGLTGASPREVRSLLLDAAHDPGHSCLSPLAVFERIESLCRRSDDYDFLKMRPDRGYHDPMGFLETVRGRWLDRVDVELRTCTGLIEETQYVELFERYVNHVSQWVKGEQVYNRVTGEYEYPDEQLMDNVEEALEIDDDTEGFRRNMISSVAAHAIDNPGESMDYARIFPRYIERLRESYYRDRRAQVAAIARDVLSLLDEQEDLDHEREARARGTLDALKHRYGYEDSSAWIALAELLRDRYE